MKQESKSKPKQKRFRVGQKIKVMVGDKRKTWWHGLKLHSIATIRSVDPKYKELRVEGEDKDNGGIIAQTIHYSQAKVIR